MITVALTRDVFNAKAAQLKAEQGIVLTGDYGVVTKDGVTIKYGFNGSEFTGEVLDKPHLVTASYCESRMRKWLGVS